MTGPDTRAGSIQPTGRRSSSTTTSQPSVASPASAVAPRATVASSRVAHLRGGAEAQAPVAAVAAHEVGHEVVVGVAEEGGGVGELGHLPAHPQHGDLVAELHGLVDVVGDEQDGLAELALQPQELVLELLAHHRVDGAERLVHEHHRRVGGQGARHPDPLLLAARELVGVAVGVRLGQADALEQLHPGGARLLAVPAQQPGHGGDVVDDGAVREQAGVLDDVADAAAQLAGVERGGVLPADGDATRGRLDHPVDHPQRRRLAAAGRTDEDGDLSLGAPPGPARPPPRSRQGRTSSRPRNESPDEPTTPARQFGQRRESRSDNHR